MKHSLAVQNVKCGGCADNIQKGLSTLPEVTELSVDVPGKRVDFAAPEAALPAIKARLAELGYPESTPQKPGLAGRLKMFVGG